MKAIIALPHRLVGYAVLITISTILSGCGTTPKGTTADYIPREQTRQIRVIGLIPPAAPDQAVVSDQGAKLAGQKIAGSLSTIAGLAGLIVGLIPEAIGDSMSKSRTERYSAQFEQSTKDRGFDVSKSLTAALAREIEKAGYQARIVEVDRGTNILFLPTEGYRNLTNAVDAFLDVCVLEYGYVNTPWKFEALPQKNFCPRILTLARLVSTSNNSNLFTKGFANFEPRLGSTNETISSAFRFSGIDELTQDHQRALQGMEDAVVHVAQKVGRSLVTHNSTVYFFRPEADDSQIVPLAIEIDGQPAPDLYSKHCVAQTVSPGKHMIHIYLKPLTRMAAKSLEETYLEIDVAENTECFVKTGLVKGFLKLDLDAVVVSEIEGKAALKRTAR